ncbi:hypothetical protein MYP_1928 [Sporocytophaga myxococcoides]|uniref:Uncharacterized protein n=1 Tax=Sporocytophaga myxococcoides TaxID=153721 RepID=A0A098LCI7_9BACT|nr:hypothetical protein [Sporocytophaga myxococcoides]GAL84700.1 hypothetical protein MYP_1928 [Sporocytophaga myxococcoides]
MLVINKIDLAPLVNVDLLVMERDAKKMCVESPFNLQKLKVVLVLKPLLVIF